MNLLDELNLAEYDLMSQLGNVHGSIENRNITILKLNIPAKYAGIHKSYHDVYHSDQNGEALKRAIFLQWYAASEPMAFIGIGDLDDNVQKSCFTFLKDMIDKLGLDDEFKTMLKHYYSVSEWYFEHYFDFSKISSYTEASKELLDFENRGQMGKYWRSLNK